MLRKFEVGDQVKARIYRKDQKWVDGVINKKIGAKMCEVIVGDNRIIRHMDQLKRSYASGSSNVESGDNDWSHNAGNYETSDVRRYPIRNRRPPIRYGIDD